MPPLSPSYLATLNNIPGVTADFIGRIPGVEVNTDKWETLAKLKPAHDHFIETLNFKPEQLFLAEQVHGTDIADVSGMLPPKSLFKQVDGFITDGRLPVLLGIYVADCAAVWLYDVETGAMGLLHSGKKGTEDHITGKAISLMTERFGSSPGSILAVISPCIRPPFYEVDIASSLYHQLLTAGVPSENITDSVLNTGADLSSFYSYRIEKGSTGRMLALLGKKT